MSVWLFVGKQCYRLNMCIIVQTDIHIFLNDRQLKLDGFQPLSIGLTLWVNLNFRNQRLHQLPLFLFIHYGIQLFKINQNLVDIISSQFLGFDCHFLCSSNDQQIFRIFNLIIHLVKSIIKIRLTLVIVLIVRVKGIYFFHKPCFDGIALPKLFFVIRNLLLNSSRIHLHVDFFLHHSGKFRIADQLHNDLSNCIVQQFFIDLLFIVALVSMGHCTVFATVIKEVLVFRTIRFMLDALVSVHSSAADRTFYNPR